MTDLATLGLRIHSQEADVAEARLDGMAHAAGRAETATDRLALAARRADGATATLNVAMRQQERANYAVRGAMGMTAAEGLNMSRQFADIGVTAAMGMNPLMIALQQGPQLLDILQQTAIRTGQTTKQVARQMAVAWMEALWPILPIIAAIAAAVAVMAGAVSLSARSINAEFGDLTKGMGLTEKQLEKVQNKGVTMGDVLVGTFNWVKGMIETVLGPTITKIGDWFDETLDRVTRIYVAVIKGFVGGWYGAFRAVRATWSLLPGVLGDIFYSAAAASINAIESMVNGAVDAINRVLTAAKAMATVLPALAPVRMIGQLDRIELNGPDNPFSGQARAAGQLFTQEFAIGMTEGGAAVDRSLAALSAQIPAAAERRIRREAGAPEAARATGGASENGGGAVELLNPMGRVNLNPLNTRIPEITTHLELLVDELRLVDQIGQDAARGLADAFGESGRAMGDLLTAMTGYQSRMAEIALAEQEHRLTATQAERERANAQVQNYGDMLGAAKGFFKEGSEGYKVLQTAEQAYRLYQFAMSVQAMLMGGKETAFTLGQNLLRAASHGVVAVARALASLPFPLNLAAAAATVAALAAIGVKLAGGGGGNGGGSGGTYNPAPINDGSVDRAKTAGAGAAREVSVRVIPNDDRFNAYVDNRTQPYANATARAGVQASRAAAPGDRARAQRFALGGRAA